MINIPDTFEMVQNDTAPDREFAITRGKSKSIVDLTGATVKFGIRSVTTGTVTNTAHQVCTITDAAKGLATYVFQGGDLPDAGGNYECDLQVTISGKNETYYKRIIIKTRPEII